METHRDGKPPLERALRGKAVRRATMGRNWYRIRDIGRQQNSELGRCHPTFHVPRIQSCVRVLGIG
jgi:hypothetical protein